MADLEQKISLNYITNANETSKTVDSLTASIDKGTDAQAKNNNENQKSEAGLKSFKTQIREATQELLKMSQTYGDTSKEAVNAAKKVADLKDQVGFANDLVDKFNPDQKFKALGAATNLATNAMTGAVSGMALFGDQSADTEKALLKVQSAMAFSQAISGLSEMGDQWATLKTVVAQNTILTKANGVATMVTTGIMKLFGGSVDDSSKSFKGLKMAIAGTGIGLLITGIAMLVTNFDSVKKVVLNLVPGLSAVGDTIMSIVNAVTDFVGVTSEADRANDRLKANAESSINLNKKYLAEHGSQLDEFTKQKIAAKDKYNAAIQEEGADRLALGQELNRELAKIEYSRGDDARKIQKENADKALDEAKKAHQKEIDDAKKRAEELLQQKKDLLEEVANKEKDSLHELQDLNDKTDQEKLDRKKERDLAEIEALKQKGADVSNLLKYNDELYITLQQELDAKNDDLEKEKQAKKIEDRRAFDEEYYTGIKEFKDAVNEEEIQQVLKHKKALLQIEEEAAIAKIDLEGGTPEEVAEKKAEVKAYYIQKDLDAEKQAGDAILAQKKAIQEGQVAYAEKGVALIKNVFGKSQAVQKAAIIAESAIGIGKSVIALSTANTAALATPQAIATSGASAIPVIALNSASAAANIASTVAATAKALKAVGGGDAGSAPNISTSGNGAPAGASGAPQVGFQSSAENQIATTLAGNKEQTPIVKAYIVSSEVTTAQAIDRNKTESNSF